MGDISEHLKLPLTVKRIYESYERKQKDHKTKSIGAGIIGNECHRYIWYIFRHCTKSNFNGRMLRLFDTGKREEERLAEDLRSIGCRVETCNKNGDQFRVCTLGGHLTGYMDGVAIGIPEAPETWHLIEFKTSNKKWFNKLKKDGVKKTKPDHYWQIMVYMHLAHITRALYLCVNKDDDEIYQERIKYDKVAAEYITKKARKIIKNVSPPERISEKRDSYKCKFCSANDLCFGSEPPLPTLPIPFISCRQCCYSAPILDGVDGSWTCDKHCKGLSFSDQLKACNDHLVLPGLLSTHEPVDYGKDKDGNNYIQFSNEVHGKWKHGKSNGMFSTDELVKLPIPILSNEMINNVKEKLGAKVLDSPDDILKDYVESKLVWKGDLNKEYIDSAWYAEYNDRISNLSPIRHKNTKTYSVAEYPGQRVIFADIVEKIAEIRDKNDRHDSD